MRVLPAATLGLLLATMVLALPQRHHDAEMGSQRRLASCSARGSDRVSCGPILASEAQCRLSGCCYDGNLLDGTARCFHTDSSGNSTAATFWGGMFRHASQIPLPIAAKPQEDPRCIFPDEERADCGFPGVIEWQCLHMGCCFGEPNSDYRPWCYKKKDATLKTTPSPTTAPTTTTLPITIAETTTTTKTGGSDVKGHDNWLTVLDALGISGLGGWGFRIVPLLIGVAAACLLGAGLIVGCGRCRRYQATNGAYNEHEQFSGLRSRNDSITGGSYQGLNPHSQYEALQNSPTESWASSRVQNPI